MSRIALLLTASLLLGASAQAAELSVADVAGLSGPDRQKILEDGARKEGELLWVGSFNEDNAKPIVEGFNKRYPYIQVKRVRTDGSKALQRVLAEMRARAPRTDLITSNAIVDLKAAGAVQPFKSPELDRFAPGDTDPKGYWAPLYFIYYGLAGYNTDLVSKSEAPKTYNDLLDPKWKGQMTFAASATGAMYFISILRMQWGDGKATEYLTKLGKQKIVARTESPRTVFGMVISGEHKIMINPFLTHIAEAARKGAPVDLSVENPAPVSATPVLLAKTAPHPHATMLLIDYLLGAEAQGMLRDAGYFPANPAVAPLDSLKPYLPQDKNFAKYIVDEAELGNMLPESTALYQRIFE